MNSVLKSKNKNFEIESRNINLYDKIDEIIEKFTQADEEVVAKAMVKNPEQLLNSTENELKNLLKYFGLHSFIYIYQVDFEYLTKIHQIISEKVEKSSERNSGIFRKVKKDYNEEKMEIIKEKNRKV